MPPVSVVICCSNVADTLEAACRSVAWADELVVVDSGSTDQTGRIAARFADRYVVEPWRGYDGQKQYGTRLCRNDWVLVLDGDEEVSGALADEIQSLQESVWERFDVAYMRRRNYVLGRPVRAWWPDWQSRLIHRHRVHWPSEVLHEDRRPSSRSRTYRLRGHLEHKRVSRSEFKDYFSGHRHDERLMMVARQMYQEGKRVGYPGLLVRPILAFAKFYFLKLGIVDGTFGLLIAQKAAVSTQLKYAALWALQQDAVGKDNKPASCEEMD